MHWDRETYPYLVAVDWVEGGPLITVLRRMQQHGLVLAVDPRTGETQVHAELADPRWVEPVAGTPCHLPDGRVLVGGELAHDGYDARCLFADGTLLTPPSLYLRRVVGRMPGPGGSPDLLVEASDGEPSEQHLFRVRTAIGGGGVESRRLTTAPGWHTGAVGGDVLVIGARSLDHTGTRWTVWKGDAQVGEAAPALGRAAGGAAARAGTGHRPAAAGRRGLPARSRRRAPAAGAAGHRRRPGAPGGAGRARPRGSSASGGPTTASRWSPSTTGVRPAWRRRSRRWCTAGWPT